MTKLKKNKSNIHGIGIFTEEFISAGEAFYIVPLSSIFNEPRPHCAFIGGSRWVNDEEVLNYINHSCEPNTILDIREHQPKLVAKRDIVVGEEIVVDYNETEVGGVEVPCNCGSDKCRGFFLRIE